MGYQAKDARAAYMNGSDKVCFIGRVPHGSGFREVRIEVPPEMVVEIGQALAPVLKDPEAGARGHAFYHYERPGTLPCSQCREAQGGPPDAMTDQIDREEWLDRKREADRKAAGLCEGCDRPAAGPHRFSCSVEGANAIRLPATKDADGTVRVVGPLAEPLVVSKEQAEAMSKPPDCPMCDAQKARVPHLEHCGVEPYEDSCKYGPAKDCPVFTLPPGAYCTECGGMVDEKMPPAGSRCGCGNEVFVQVGR